MTSPAFMICFFIQIEKRAKSVRESPEDVYFKKGLLLSKTKTNLSMNDVRDWSQDFKILFKLYFIF